jgi:hypothetical protein
VCQPAHPGKWNAQALCCGRYWVDLPATERQRRTVALGICATKTIARNRLRDYIQQQQGVNDATAFHQNTAPAITFAQQAEDWLSKIRVRRRKPVKPATLAGWRESLDKWLLTTDR